MPSLLERLKQGIQKTRAGLVDRVEDVIHGKKEIDADLLEELEYTLISADVGVRTATDILETIRQRVARHLVNDASELRQLIQEHLQGVLEASERPMTRPAEPPRVVMVVGVNGSGKTTTIGKLARLYQSQGKKVMLAAGDTFRAAAVEQLKIWGERANVPVIARGEGADPAGLAFDALTEAKAKDIDLLLIDTAGRLQNKAGLMEELAKIVRVIKKVDATAPHDCLLVLDATVGQNAHSQVDIFKQICQVTGLVVTKLDGSAKGGVLVALAERFGLPVVAIGVGEGQDDLKPFEAQEFARSLMDVG